MTQPNQLLLQSHFYPVKRAVFSIVLLGGGWALGQGYQVQGPFPEGGNVSAVQAAPQQAYIPPPATGLAQFNAGQPTLSVPQQPAWQAASPYAVQSRDAPASAMAGSQYRAQFQAQPQAKVTNPYSMQPRQTPPKSASRSPYQAQTPVRTNVAPMPPQYAPMTGGFTPQPMPYPEFASPKPKAPGNGGASVRSEIEGLKRNDRLQDARLSNLESAIGEGRVQRHEVVPSSKRHRVEMGESLWTIADDHGISVEELKRMNHRTSNVVMPGELLTVPGGRSSGSSSLASSSSKGTKGSSSGPAVHVVQRGESLSQIAAAYKTSLSSLQSANKIRNPNLISPGQRLLIPGRSGSARAVKTLPTSTQSLASAQVRSQPRTEKAKSKPSSEAISPSVPSSGLMQNTSKSAPRSVVSYRVEGGDSIEAVARNFNTTPGEIQRINKLPATKLPAVGEEIIVPLPSLVSL